jgi:hypothetical protein
VRRLLLLLALLLLGCAGGPHVDPDALHLVSVEPVEEPGLAEQFRLEFRAVAASDPEGRVHLRLPLPVAAAVTMLAWEVGPHTEADLRDGVLHVTSPAGFPDIVVRAIVEMPNGSLAPDFRELVSGPVYGEAGGQAFDVTLEGRVD